MGCDRRLHAGPVVGKMVNCGVASTVRDLAVCVRETGVGGRDLWSRASPRRLMQWGDGHRAQGSYSTADGQPGICQPVGQNVRRHLSISAEAKDSSLRFVASVEA